MYKFEQSKRKPGVWGIESSIRLKSRGKGALARNKTRKIGRGQVLKNPVGHV